MVEAHGNPDAFVGRSFNVEVRPSILAQRLNNKRSNFSRNGPHDAFRQTHTVVCNDHLIAVLTFAQALNRDDATATASEGILERVGHQLIYDKTDGQCDIDGNWSMIHFQIKPDSIGGVGVHDGGCDLTQVMSKIDFVSWYIR